MYDIGIVAKESTHSIKTGCYHTKSHEKQQVVVGKKVDELRDRVVRRNALQ